MFMKVLIPIQLWLTVWCNLQGYEMPLLAWMHRQAVIEQTNCGVNKGAAYLLTRCSSGRSPPNRKQFFTGAAVMGGGTGQFSAAM